MHRLNNYDLKKIHLVLLKYKGLISNFGYLSLLQLLSILLPMMTYPYLIRVLGAEKYGLIAYSQAIIGYFLVIINFGFNISEIKDISIERNNEQKISEIVSSVITIKTIFALASIVSIILLVCLFDTFKEYKFLYIAYSGVILDEAINPKFYFQGIEKMKFISIFTMLSKIIFVILIFLLVRNTEQFEYVPLLTSIGSIIGSFGSIYIVFFKHRIKFRLYPLKTIFKHLKESIPFFTSRISVIINTKTNVLLIGSFLGYNEVAYYDLADKITSVLKIPFNIINQVLFPNVAKSNNVSLVIKVLKYLLTIYFITYVSMFFWGKEAIILLGSINLIPATTTLFILGFTIITELVVVFLGVNTLLISGYKKEYNISIIYGSIFYLFLILLLYFFNYFNLISLSITTVVSSFFILLYRFYFCRKYKLI